ncbi:ROK family protein [Bosea sp. (in: a-proteobacteria)]|uniref:ROK family protein n=1 Tax=Bosea sp. (in: a-proteobacteria) TaxID=1871050 RepID=UPI002B4AA4C7|nr:ROK family protein [Bosea sp. (in: a-proteobacteria)]WRH57929.1 MAG: ROK family protein [Bosea sp. (in: a-proteobacteria)]
MSDKTGLTDASISRIVADLKAENLVEETRLTAPYQGGPSAFLTLSKDRHVGAVEFSSGRVHVGVGSLTGEIRFSEWLELPDDADLETVRATYRRALHQVTDYVRRTGIQLRQIAVSIPGYHEDLPVNPIIAIDPAGILADIQTAQPGVALLAANSIMTRAVAHQLKLGVSLAGGPYLYVFVGHGVAAALVDDFAVSGDVAPCEIGHMVLDPRGPRCRCGHSGCLEAYVSTAAIAPAIGVREQDLLAMGAWQTGRLKLSARSRGDLSTRLVRLGHALGNTLNLTPIRRVVVAGWPAELGDQAPEAVRVGIDASLFGGASTVNLAFSNAELGREPAAGLALATYAYLQRGAMRAEELAADIVTNDPAQR